MPKQTFEHSPLPPGQFFRLLKILPGSVDDPTQCELLTLEFETAPDYEPISYAWGDPAMSHEITCNGYSMFITKTLFQALRRFRQAQPRLLWADGICINQNDEAEKGVQVQFMSNIYERGYRTLVWLGEDDEHQDCAMTDPGCVENSLAMIKQLNSYVQAQVMAMDRTGDANIFASLRRIPSKPPELVLWREENRQRCLEHLFRRPWFSRCWVMKEVGLSTRATAFIGKLCIEWSEIALCAENCSRTLIAGTKYMPTARICNAFEQLWATMARQESWIYDLWLLQKFAQTSRQFSASELKDHVFAFLGHPILQGLIDTDYSLTLAEIHQRLAEELLLKSRRLDMLCYVENRLEDLSSFASVPSWVPQWHREVLLYRPDPSGWTGIEVNSDEIVMDASGNQLHVAALLVDQVDNHSEVLVEEDLEATFDGTNPHVVQHLYNMYQHALRAANKVTSRDPWDIFIMTLNFGTYFNPKCVEQDFLAWCQEHCDPQFYQLAADDLFFQPEETLLLPPNGDEFEDSMGKALDGRKFFTTRGGRRGLGPGILEQNDILAIVFSCRMPLLLRPAETLGTYRVVGQCYIYELMFDEEDNFAATNWRNDSLKKEIICLV
ncbi:hypothetical protein EG329_002641 [Mollisiaceae sp. DMI_Dod_QoI]|nr:hypothetical protein EG329_002641 [Helotiales sp. DMI_Dod_QoI]